MHFVNRDYEEHSIHEKETLITHRRSEGGASTDGSECVGGKTPAHCVHYNTACDAQVASDRSRD